MFSTNSITTRISSNSNLNKLITTGNVITDGKLYSLKLKGRKNTNVIEKHYDFCEITIDQKCNVLANSAHFPSIYYLN